MTPECIFVINVANDISHIVYRYITKRLVWADNMLCVPEQLVDSDVVAREGNVSLGESP